MDISPSQLRSMRRRRVERLAAGQAGVVSRRQVYALGITRWEVRASLRAGRWRSLSPQSLEVPAGSMTDHGRFWVAVFEGGPRAFVDGVSALQVAGLRKFDQELVRVSVPRGARVRRARGIDIRQTRRWDVTDLASGSGVPRSRPEVAAVRAALWARSNRQAALILTMAVQQGLCVPEGLAREFLRIRRDRRRSLVQAVILDLMGGVRSLGELDFARECRRRGLPEPSRQVLRRGPHGTYYLDVIWDEWGVVVEIDGIQHSWAQNVVSDALRQNDVSLEGAVVLRLPLLGLRVAADDFFEQIEKALRGAGCRTAGRHARRAL